MSKAPSTAAEYLGDGAWFKIKDWGPTFSGSSSTWPLARTLSPSLPYNHCMSLVFLLLGSPTTANTPHRAETYTYTIPTCLADGEYLLRIQSLAIHNPYPGGIPQFYVECAQVSVTGGTNVKTPTPTASIPGAFHSTDPGYTVNIYNNFKNYTVPGPAVVCCIVLSFSLCVLLSLTFVGQFSC
jgi:hypothetical protein